MPSNPRCEVSTRTRVTVRPAGKLAVRDAEGAGLRIISHLPLPGSVEQADERRDLLRMGSQGLPPTRPRFPRRVGSMRHNESTEGTKADESEGS